MLPRPVFVLATLVGLVGCGGQDAPTASAGSTSSSSSTGAGGSGVACSTSAPVPWSTAIQLDPVVHGEIIDTEMLGVAPFDDGVVIAGQVSGASTDIGPSHLGAPPDDDFDYLARFDACGVPLWGQKFPPYGIAITGVAADGDVLVDADRGAAEGLVLVAIDGSGAATDGAAVQGASCLDIARGFAGPGGTLVLSGFFGNGGKAGAYGEPVLDASSPSGVSCGDPSAFGNYAIEFDAQGHAVWLHKMPTTDWFGAGFVASLNAEHVAITATLGGDLDLGTMTLSPPDGAPTRFTALLDANGDAIWATLDVGGAQVSLAADDTVTVTGACATGMSLTGLDATGATSWAFCSPASSGSAAIALAPDASAVFVAGGLVGSFDLAGAPAPAKSMFVARFVGGALTSQQLYGGSEQTIDGLVATRDGVILVGENYGGFGTVDFGQGPIVGEKGQQTFLAHLVFAP